MSIHRKDLVWNREAISIQMLMYSLGQMVITIIHFTYMVH